MNKIRLLALTLVITLLTACAPSAQAGAVLSSNGFVRIAAADDQSLCKGGKCESYQLRSDGLGAGVFPNGTLSLSIVPGDQINSTTQQNTLAHVITQLFGKDINTWIIDHLAESVTTNQEGDVSGRHVEIMFVELFGARILTMIIIGPKGTSK